MRMVRSAVALAVATGLTGGLSACGGDDSAGPAPSSASPSESTSASPTASPTPSSTPSLRPLSAYEDRPPVKAARQMASRLGRAVNAKDRSMGTLGRYATAAAKREFDQISSGDYGTYFPGPQPFTPVAVKTVRNTSVVTACWWSRGWGLDRKTKLPAGNRKIDPARITLVRSVAGQWQVDSLYRGTNDCSGVNVKGRPW